VGDAGNGIRSSHRQRSARGHGGAASATAARFAGCEKTHVLCGSKLRSRPASRSRPGS